MIRAFPRGRQRIAARLPAENLCGMSAEKGKLSVSSTVFGKLLQQKYAYIIFPPEKKKWRMAELHDLLAMDSYWETLELNGLRKWLIDNI